MSARWRAGLKSERTPKLSPAAQKAYNNMHKAVELHKRGEIHSAEKLYRKILKLTPRNFDALRFLGSILLQRHQFRDAVTVFSKALKIKPDQVDVLNESGEALLGLQRESEALAMFERAAKIDPTSPVTLNNIGNAQSQMENHTSAIASYERALAIKPDMAEVQNNLGSALARTGEWDRAIARFQSAVKISPKFALAHASLGATFKKVGRYEEAITSYRRALEIAPDKAELHVALGNVYREHGRIEEAMKCYRRAIEIQPDFGAAITNLGTSLVKVGQLDAAESCYKNALVADPCATENYRLLTAMKGYSEQADEVVEMECKYSDKHLTDEQRMHLAFALGRVFENFHDYDKSFAYLKTGNELKRNMYEYSIDKHVKLFDKIKGAFTEKLFSDRAHQVKENVTPIFIVGMPRSGTTLIEQILASHQKVFGGGELEILNQLIAKHFHFLKDDNFADSILTKPEEIWRNLGAEYLRYIDDRTNSVPFFTDKMPVNFVWIGFIRLALPNAKIIHCVRDPIDNCMSIYKLYFSERGHPYAYDLVELGRFHNMYRELMAHWRATIPGFVFDVHYEEVVENLEVQTRKLLEFCGLEWDDGCLAFHESRRIVNTASELQVKRPIYKTAVQSWKRFESHLSPLTEILKQGI